MRRMRTIGAATAVLAAAIAAFLTFGAGAGTATGPCTKFAAPGGSDSNAGTEGSPFLTVQRLSDSLSPGDVGCLRAGTYTADVTITRGGSSTADVTITAYPDEEATVVGRLRVTRTAPYLTIEGLNLVGLEQARPGNCGGFMCPSPTINANDVSLIGNDITNDHRGICVLLGDSNGVYGRADDARVIGNRIHDCGRLPATNHDHGIYAQATAGSVISDNYIYGNADKGINLWPDADETLITRNVIAHNGHGIMFAGSGTQQSDDNTVTRNVIAHSSIRFNIDSWWDSGVGPRGNVVSDNCLFNDHIDDWYNWEGGIGDDDPLETGYTVSGTVIPTPDPEFVDPLSGDYRLSGTSDCLPLFTATSATALSTDVPD